jgi:hypothetical protein
MAGVGDALGSECVLLVWALKIVIRPTQFWQRIITNGQREDGQQERSYAEESIR